MCYSDFADGVISKAQRTKHTGDVAIRPSSKVSANKHMKAYNTTTQVEKVPVHSHDAAVPQSTVRVHRSLEGRKRTKCLPGKL